MEEPLQILIIDDDEVDRTMARRALRASGIGGEFVEATGAAEGIAALLARPFDCALVDYRLPDGDGLSIVRAVRDAGVFTPIILLTGQGDEQLALDLMKAGANDYLSKSRLSRDLLSHSVRHVVRLRRAQSEADQARVQSAESERRFQLMADTAPLLLWVADERSRAIYFNQGWLRFTGRAPAEEAGAGWMEGIHPDDRDRVTRSWDEATAGRAKFQIEFRLRRADGAYRWVLDSAAPRLLPDGAFAGYVGSCVDITDRKADEQERAGLLAREQTARAAAEESELRYRLLAESIPQLVFSADVSGRTGYVNRRMSDYLGFALDADGGKAWARIIHPDDREATLARWDETLRSGVSLEAEFRLRRHDGAYRWHLGRAEPLRDGSGQIVKWLGTCTDVDDRRRAAEATRFLAEASVVLGSSLDYETTLASVTRLAVPQVADFCAVDMPGPDGLVRRLAMSYGDAGRGAAARELLEQYPTRVDEDHPIAEVLRTGQPQLVAEVPDDRLRAMARDERHLDILRRMRVLSVLVVPLVSRGRALGAITMVTSESGRRLGPADLALAEDLARRAAMAVDNARLYRDARDALNAQQRATALLDTVLAAAPVGFAFLDPHLRFVRINNAMAVHDGLSPEAHLSRTLAEAAPGLEGAFGPYARAVLDGGQPVLDVEVRGPSAAHPGADRDLLASFYPVRSPSGEVLGVGAVVADITERKRAEVQLRESEERYRLVSRATNDVIWDWNLVTNHLSWSEALAQHVGYTPAEIEQLNPSMEWRDANIHPDDRRRVQDGVRAAIEGGASAWSDEYRFRRRDGTYAAFLDRGLIARDAEGRAYRMIGSMLDLTENKRAQEALRVSRERLDLVVQSSALGLWYCDLPFGELEWNAQCKEHFGLPADARVTIDTFYDLIHPDDRAATRAEIERSIAERTEYDIVYRTIGQPEGPEPGRVRWVRAIGRAFFDESGKPARFDGITVDVTSQKRAEQELQDAKEGAEAAREQAEMLREQAEAANAAKDQFLAVLSHELRTPLTPVLTTVQTLEADPSLPAELRESLDMIRRNVELEARLIDDLLDLTRVAKNKLELNLQTVDVHETLSSALEICRDDVRAKQLTVETDLRAGQHHVRADAARLHQVFWNLIKNAVKFTPAGGAIFVRTLNDEPGDVRGVEAAAAGQPRLVVEVRDTGVGIDPLVLPRIFEAFEQGERAVTRKFGGLGLGLAISKALVEMQGGGLSADSPRRWARATFTVDLASIPAPRRQRPHDDSDDGTNGDGREASAPRPAAPPRRRLNILLVDDHVDTTRAMRLLLRRLGHSVTTAGSVGAALDAYASDTFDLLISDIGLPDASGLDLMRRIRAMPAPPEAADGPCRPLCGIALSGFGMEEDVRQSMAAGFFAHLTKPINFQTLEAVIRQATSDK